MHSRYIRILDTIIELKELEDGRKVAVYLDTGKEEEWGVDEKGFFLKSYNDKTKMTVTKRFSENSDNLELRAFLVKWFINEHYRKVTGDYPCSSLLDAEYSRFLLDKVYIRIYSTNGEFDNYISYNEIYFCGDLGETTFIKTKYFDYESNSKFIDIVSQARKNGLKNFQRVSIDAFVNLNFVSSFDESIISFFDISTQFRVDSNYLVPFTIKLNNIRKQNNEAHSD
ncbi:hypothetical protein MKZ15_06215 [Paenibacillus sp. FSL R7-0216]|uniref:hypothetical protein n=1 Tax=Paenibacillus sp. FSL R7-0216 TaxID=2921677 RepID=UPI0030DB1A71